MQLFGGADTFWPLGGRSALDFTLQWFRRTGPRPFPFLAGYVNGYGTHVCASGGLNGTAGRKCAEAVAWLPADCSSGFWELLAVTLWSEAALWRVGRINRCRSRLTHPHSMCSLHSLLCSAIEAKWKMWQIKREVKSLSVSLCVWMFAQHIIGLCYAHYMTITAL